MSAPKMQPVSSSNVSSVGYDGETGTLYVAFKNGGTYRYMKVPEEIYEGLVKAESVGGYLAKNVKGTYTYQKA